MLNDNIRNLRKLKGMTQEELALRLHVVRQTVSKWEKGISVPDAETLQRIAEELQVSVNELLGAEVKVEENHNELAEQLSRINEQLAVRNHRTVKLIKILKAIVIFVVAVILLRIVLTVAGMTLFSFRETGYTTSMNMNQENPVYQEEEVRAAMDEVVDYFKHNMKGCQLKSIDYDEEYSKLEAENRKKDYNTDQILVLTSSIHTDQKGVDGSLDSDTDYDGWNWILVKEANGEWNVAEWLVVQ